VAVKMDNAVEYGGQHYAVMDGTPKSFTHSICHAEPTCETCQSHYTPMPVGWQPAQFSVGMVANVIGTAGTTIQPFAWGAVYIVLADGNSYTPMQQSPIEDGVHQLLSRESSGGLLEYRAKDCGKVLMSTACAMVEASELTDAPTKTPTHAPTNLACGSNWLGCDIRTSRPAQIGVTCMCECLEGFVTNPVNVKSCLATNAPTPLPTLAPKRVLLEGSAVNYGTPSLSFDMLIEGDDYQPLNATLGGNLETYRAVVAAAIPVMEAQVDVSFLHTFDITLEHVAADTLSETMSAYTQVLKGALVGTSVAVEVAAEARPDCDATGGEADTTSDAGTVSHAGSSNEPCTDSLFRATVRSFDFQDAQHIELALVAFGKLATNARINSLDEVLDILGTLLVNPHTITHNHALATSLGHGPVLISTISTVFKLGMQVHLSSTQSAEDLAAEFIAEPGTYLPCAADSRRLVGSAMRLQKAEALSKLQGLFASAVTNLGDDEEFIEKDEEVIDDPAMLLNVDGDADTGAGSYDATYGSYGSDRSTCFVHALEVQLEESGLEANVMIVNPAATTILNPTGAPTAAPTAAHCIDGERSDDESDVDCGGSHCPGCELGQTCKKDSDCSSGNCAGGSCTTPAPTPIPTIAPTPCIADPMTHAISFEGHQYAVMDNTPKFTTEMDCEGDPLCSTCQSHLLQMPQGWEVADFTELVVNKVVREGRDNVFRWGTNWVVLSNGHSYSTSPMAHLGTMPTHAPTGSPCEDGSHSCDLSSTRCEFRGSGYEWSGILYECMCREGFVPDGTQVSCARPPTASPTTPPTKVEVLCSNDCWAANDGVCDDGLHLWSDVHDTVSHACDYGHDCADCGTRYIPERSDAGDSAAAPSSGSYDGSEHRRLADSEHRRLADDSGQTAGALEKLQGLFASAVLESQEPDASSYSREGSYDATFAPTFIPTGAPTSIDSFVRKAPQLVQSGNWFKAEGCGKVLIRTICLTAGTDFKPVTQMPTKQATVSPTAVPTMDGVAPTPTMAPTVHEGALLSVGVTADLIVYSSDSNTTIENAQVGNATVIAAGTGYTVGSTITLPKSEPVLAKALSRFEERAAQSEPCDGGLNKCDSSTTVCRPLDASEGGGLALGPIVGPAVDTTSDIELAQAAGRKRRSLRGQGVIMVEEKPLLPKTAAGTAKDKAAETDIRGLAYWCDCLTGFVPNDTDYYSCSPATATATATDLTDSFQVR
jgi:hypothetical protein